MFFVTVKASTLKFCVTLVLGVLLVTGLVFLLPEEGALSAGNLQGIRYDGIESYADMAVFLSQFGWQIGQTPESDENVVLPQRIEGVFYGYNQLQKEQGLDLEPYGGKRVRKVVFTVKNYKDGSLPVLATLFVYRNRVIAGDLSAADPEGFSCGFAGEKQ